MIECEIHRDYRSSLIAFQIGADAGRSKAATAMNRNVDCDMLRSISTHRQLRERMN